MNLSVAIQQCIESAIVPDEAHVRRWAESAYAAVADGEAAVTIRIVDEEESGDLNKKFRGGAAATNVLSFSYAEDPYAGGLLGDVVICAPVVMREALEQNKTVEAHWAHMIVHGVLHLCGYTHDQDQDARTMERLEMNILSGFGFPSPYS